MARRPRVLTEADLTEWAQFARAIVPLRGHPPYPPEDRPPPITFVPPVLKPAAAVATPRAVPSMVAVGGQPGGLDSSTWHRFRAGKLAVTRKLDLHGMTTQHAFRALISFLRAAHAERLRCVEVVTGRGTVEGGGAIRRELPMWLNLPDIRPLVLAAVHPHPANPGAVRLLLKRHR